jgi:hypothetical protein
MGLMAFFGKLFGKDKENGAILFGKKGGAGIDGEGDRLTCVECRGLFLFEPGEQKFYKMRGLTPPKRCPKCRTKRRRRRR